MHPRVWKAVAIAGLLAIGAWLLLADRGPDESRLAHVFTFREPGLYVHLDSTAPTDAVRVFRAYREPDARLPDDDLRQRWGQVRFVRLDWTHGGPSGPANFTLTPGQGSMVVVAQVPLGHPADNLRAPMAAFLANVTTFEAASHPRHVDAWLNASRPIVGGCLAGDTACQPRTVGTDYTLVVPPAAVDAARFLAARGGAASGTEEAGPFGEARLRWPDALLTFGYQTLTASFPDSPYVVVVNVRDEVMVRGDQANPVPEDEMPAVMRDVLGRLGVGSPALEGLRAVS